VLADEAPTVSREELLRRLKQLGVDAQRGDKLTIITDDRGIECPDWHRIEPYFPRELKEKILTEVRRQVGDQDPELQAVPGVETTWWFNTAGGVSALLEHLNKAYEGYEKATGVPLPRRIRSVCATTLVEVDLGKDATSARNAKPTVRNYSGSTMYALRAPAPGAEKDDSYSWLVPESEVATDDRSVAQRIALGVDGAYVEELPWMKVKVAMEASGVRFAKPEETHRVPDYRIRTFGTPGTSRVGDAWQLQARNFAKLSQRPLAPQRPPSKVLMPPAAATVGPSSFDPHAIERLMLENDALVFASTPETVLGRTRLAYEYFSAKVARHEHSDRKGLLLLVSSQDAGLQIMQRLSQTIYGSGLAEKPELLTSIYADDEQGLALVRQHWKQYRRVLASPSNPIDPFDARTGLNEGRSERRRAGAYFCSAKSVAPDLVDGAEAIGGFLAENGLDMSYGAGSKGMMGRASRRFVEVSEHTGSGARLAGISTPMVIKLETADGKVPEWVNVGHIASDIVVRMKTIIECSDFIIVDKGGDGTLQELLISIALKEADDPLMRGKPIVILNAPLSNDVRLFDPFIEFYGPFGKRREERLEQGREVLRGLGVHVIESRTRKGLEEDVAGVLGL